MNIRTQSKLLQLAIFSSTSEKLESTADLIKQIHYYFPSTDSDDLKVRSVGLAMTLYGFAENLNEGNDRDNGLVWGCTKSKSVLLEIRKDIFVLMKLRYSASLLSIDDKRYVNYEDYLLPDEWIVSYVKRLIGRYELLNDSIALSIPVSSTPKASSLKALESNATGSPSKALIPLEPGSRQNSLDALAKSLYNHFSTIQTVLEYSILTMMNGFESSPFLLATNQSIVLLGSRLNTLFPTLPLLLILYDHSLLYSSFENTAHASTLYDYLTDPETGKFDDGIVNQCKQKGEAVISVHVEKKSWFGGSKKRGFKGFLVGGGDTKIVYLDGTAHSILVYQSDRFTFAFLTPFTNEADAGLCESVAGTVEMLIEAVVVGGVKGGRECVVFEDGGVTCGKLGPEALALVSSLYLYKSFRGAKSGGLVGTSGRREVYMKMKNSWIGMQKGRKDLYFVFGDKETSLKNLESEIGRIKAGF